MEGAQGEGRTGSQHSRTKARKGGSSRGRGLGSDAAHASQMPLEARLSRGQGWKSGLEIISPLSWLTHGGAVPIGSSRT